jgi:hypothetical protein
LGDCATQKMRFETTPLVLEAAFDGGRLTSDGGLCWLAETDEELRLCEKIASHVPEWRKGASLRHSLKTLVRQRVLQIACGYEDQNDSNTLRSDPLLKLVCGRLPETDADLASQPTISRLENAPDGRACLRMAEALGELYLRERGKNGAPVRVSFWTLTPQTTPLTASRKVLTTTATTKSTSSIHSWSSTARPVSSSRHY